MDFENQWKSVKDENQKIKDSADQRIWNGLESKIKSRNNTKRILWVAAVLLPLFTVMTLFFTGNEMNSSGHQQMVFRTEKIQKEFTLSDGSTITLEPESELKLTENFGKKTRNVSFKGKAFFSVAKNKALPFIIDANGFKVKVLGTKFLLDQRSEDKKVYLKEGKVKIDYNGHTTFLLPKETWLADKDGTEKHFYDQDVVRTFDFNEMKFGQAISQLEKTYNISITYPQHYKENIIDGDITGDLGKVIKTIGFPFNLKTRKESENYIILEK
ncbi:FecR family protein [Chryseobacterium viscerum]|uniref:FecR domain-containing protein n=1 Tax=Chryseobacterium viscerum TaxID=1037377 RepID=A0A5N4BWC6_9FLAO|nr:FecR family protein [Chryseobacterium viscerum]KAB1232335.1 FecR domain-containing protein [Chryseobacterium viscerum]